MMLSQFEYCAARGLEEAATLWGQAPGARYLAGGTDLLPQMRSRRKVTRLVDLKNIAELSAIKADQDGNLVVGATATLAAIAAFPAVQARYPLLAECCRAVGAYPLRHRATMAGNICNASPAADTAVALLVLDAQVLTYGPQGGRTIPMAQFFRGPGKTALTDGELVKAIVLPATAADWQGSYLRLARRQGMDLATLGVLVAHQPGKTTAPRIALAAVAPTPLRAREAEALLAQDGLSETSIMQAAELARLAASPISDVRGSAEYRREMVGILVARGLKTFV